MAQPEDGRVELEAAQPLVDRLLERLPPPVEADERRAPPLPVRHARAPRRVERADDEAGDDRRQEEPAPVDRRQLADLAEVEAVAAELGVGRLVVDLEADVDARRARLRERRSACARRVAGRRRLRPAAARILGGAGAGRREGRAAATEVERAVVMAAATAAGGGGDGWDMLAQRFRPELAGDPRDGVELAAAAWPDALRDLVRHPLV